MDLEKGLVLVGVLGFASVFQVVGVALGRGIVGSIVKSARKGELRARDLPGAVFALAFAGLWAFMPFAMALEFGGWPWVAAQAVVFCALVGFVAVPHPPEPAAPDRAADPRAPDTRPGPWRRAAAAFPSLFLAAAFGAALAGRALSGFDARWLCSLVKIEFLVVHSFPFLAIITLPRLGWLRWRVFQWFLFVTWFCLYLGFAVADDHGLGGLVAFLSGTFATYLGFILRKSGKRKIAVLTKRWGASFLLLVLFGALTGSDDWHVSPATLRHGLLYFAALGLVELAGLHERNWRRLFARDRRAPAAQPSQRTVKPRKRERPLATSRP